MSARVSQSSVCFAPAGERGRSETHPHSGARRGGGCHLDLLEQHLLVIHRLVLRPAVSRPRAFAVAPVCHTAQPAESGKSRWWGTWGRRGSSKQVGGECRTKVDDAPALRALGVGVPLCSRLSMAFQRSRAAAAGAGWRCSSRWGGVGARTVLLHGWMMVERFICHVCLYGARGTTPG